MAAGKISSLLEKWRYKLCFDRPAASASSSTEAFLKPKRLKAGTTALKDSYVIAVIPRMASSCPFPDDVMKDPLMIVAGVSVTFGKPAGARMSWECESVLDHFERASTFLALGNKTPHLKLKRWAYLSALNSLRAVFEITSTALEESHLKGDPELFDREAEQKVLYFKTVENVRIQDFHRRALMLQPVRIDSFGTVKLGNTLPQLRRF